MQAFSIPIPSANCRIFIGQWPIVLHNKTKLNCTMQLKLFHAHVSVLWSGHMQIESPKRRKEDIQTIIKAYQHNLAYIIQVISTLHYCM